MFEAKVDRPIDPDVAGWKKDGVFIDPFDPKYKVEEKQNGLHHRLIIPKPTEEDAGHYAFDTGDEESVCAALVKGKSLLLLLYRCRILTQGDNRQLL